MFVAGSRPPLILQSPPPYASSPREAGADQKQLLQQRKKTTTVKEEKDLYDIVSSPNKDSTKLTLKLSRVKSNESDPAGIHFRKLVISYSILYRKQVEVLGLFKPSLLRFVFFTSSGDVGPGMDQNSDNIEGELGFQHVPVLQPNLAARQQHQPMPLQTGGAGGLLPPGSPCDEVELDALAEIERIEREAASEKCSKEVQDKGVLSYSFLCCYR